MKLEHKHLEILTALTCFVIALEGRFSSLVELSSMYMLESSL